MKLLYDNSGKLFYAVYDRDWFAFSHSTNIPLTEMTIDEVDPVNKTLCLDLRKTVDKVDVNGDGKYYAASGVLMERAGWKEMETYG